MSLKTSMSGHQQMLFRAVYEQRTARWRLALGKFGLRRKEIDECLRVSAALIKDPSVRIAINMDLRLRVHKDSLAEGLLVSGRLLNLFEQNTAQGNQDDFSMRQRLLKEFRIYGASKGLEMVLALLPEDEHPIYGILDYLGDPFKMRGTFYGPYRFVLKRDFLERATFTGADSYATGSDDVFCWQDIRGVLAANVAEENDAKWYTYVAEKHAPDVGSSLPSYIEAQVLGPVHLVDVERLYFPCHDLLDPWFMTVLRSLAEKYEFELVHY